MTTPTLTSFPLDDDRPTRPDPKEDCLSSAQFRRFLKTLKEDSPNDYGYSD